jgi:hypothetical protein
MLVPNSQYIIAEVSKSTYEKYAKAWSESDRDEAINHTVWEGKIYAIGEEGFSQNPVAAASDNQFVFARMPDPMGLKKGDAIVSNHFPTHGTVHEGKFLFFVYKEGILCAVRDQEQEINLFNQEMPPVVPTTGGVVA